MKSSVLPVVVVVLALVDGLIHLFLDLDLFHANFFQNTLSELFALNFLGYVALVVLFVVTARATSGYHRAVGIVLACFATATLTAWVGKGGPDPFHFLGYLSKVIEVVLIATLIVYTTRASESEVPSLAKVQG